MANPFVKAWKYFLALFDNKIEENADPKIQIEQAIGEAKRQHQELSHQAAAVIGNQRQLEMKLNRQLADIEKLNANVRQALLMAEEARAEGNAEKAQEYENAASAFSAQLVAAEKNVEDLKSLYDQASDAAAQAKAAVKRNSHALQAQLAERTKLLNQLDQAVMQEKVSGTMRQLNALEANSNVPNLEQVRSKIEQRYARALGSTELQNVAVHDRMTEIESRSNEYVTNSKLEEIRAQMQAKGELPGGSSSKQEQITAGESDEAQD